VGESFNLGQAKKPIRGTVKKKKEVLKRGMSMQSKTTTSAERYKAQEGDTGGSGIRTPPVTTHEPPQKPKQGGLERGPGGAVEVATVKKTRNVKTTTTRSEKKGGTPAQGGNLGVLEGVKKAAGYRERNETFQKNRLTTNRPL